MLGKEIIRKELTRVDIDVKTPIALFECMGKTFLEMGYVNDKYVPSIISREKEYPTALPVEPYPIAIPHTEADAIIKPFIAPVRLKETVEWGDMSDLEKTLNVKLVFLLGFNDPNAHIELLQILIYNFQRPEWVEKLFYARTDEELYDAVYSMEWKHE